MQAHVIANAKQSMQTTTAIPEVANAASDGDARCIWINLELANFLHLSFAFEIVDDFVAVRAHDFNRVQ